MPQTAAMDLARARYLSSPAGQSALASIPGDWAALPLNALATRLRTLFPAAEAAALGEQVSLRNHAGDRLWHPEALLSADGLQMATHPKVAARRAARLAATGLPLGDLTAGLGSDLWACIQAGIDAAGVERDAATAVLCASNTEGRAVRGDALQAPCEPERMAILLDPSRRDPSGRRLAPAAFLPAWEDAMGVARSAKTAVVKGPPGINHSDIPPEAEVEFIQLGRTLREAALWFGQAAKPGLRRAILLPADATLSSDDPEGSEAVVPPGEFIFDPESCVTRAGLVRHLGARVGGMLMDPHVAYLTAGAPAFDPLCATFEVVDVLPFSVGRLKRVLRQRGWQATEIRRRAFPIEPDELRKLLGHHQGEDVTLMCTTLGGRRTVIIGRRLRSEDETANGCRQ